MAKERANAPLGLFFSSFSSHARRLGTGQLEDADAHVRLVSKITFGWDDGRFIR